MPMSGALTQEVEADVGTIWLDILLAVIVVSALATSYYLTRGANKVISLSLLAGYFVFLVDFYGKDLVEIV